jgi:outer membrane protein assembly factor BamB
VRYENGKYTELIKKLRNPNGIDSISIDGHPFGLLSCTYRKKVYRFDTQTGEKKKIAKVKGGDNFTYNEGKVLLAGHLRFYKFIGHIKKNKPSPSVVYELDVMNRTKKAVFVDDGRQISTVSTALYFNNRIYLGQIFDDFVLVGFVGR